MSDERFYLVDIADWAAKTAHLSLELEGAYLRLCNFAHEHGTLIVASRWQLQGMFRCGATRARALVRRLEDAGLVERREGDAVRILGVRLRRLSISQALRAQIMDRDGEVCRYCATDEGPFEIDHIAPVARGGSNAPENLCVACVSCNRSKGAKLIGEWLQ